MSSLNEIQFSASLEALVGNNNSACAPLQQGRMKESNHSHAAGGGQQHHSLSSSQHTSMMMHMPLPTGSAATSRFTIPSNSTTTTAAAAATATTATNLPSLNLANMVASSTTTPSQISTNLYLAGPPSFPVGNNMQATTTGAGGSYNNNGTTAPLSSSSSSSSRGPITIIVPATSHATMTSMIPSMQSMGGMKREREMELENLQDAHNTQGGGGDVVKRRQDRNKREQQRSQQITTQIANLKKVLVEANVQFKPDKYSTLVSVVDYVRQLQQRSKMLDSEHVKLLDTITKTSDVVNSSHHNATSSSCLPPDVVSSDFMGDGGVGGGGRMSPLQDESMVLVRGLDYQAVFGCCPLAFAIASVDGRFLDCNTSFEEVTGYTRNEFLPSQQHHHQQQQQQQQQQHDGGSDSDLTNSDSDSGSNHNSNSGSSNSRRNVEKNKSLFNILNHDDAGIRGVFTAMSDMLRRPVVDGCSSMDVSAEDCWSGEVHIGRYQDKKMKLTLSLVRTQQGRPRFFSLTLIALD